MENDVVYKCLLARLTAHPERTTISGFSLSGCRQIDQSSFKWL